MYRTFEDLKRLLSATAGDLTTIDRDDFDKWLAEPIEGLTALDHLEAAGLRITTRRGEIVEKAGLMGLAAAVREIAAGRFPERQSPPRQRDGKGPPRPPEESCPNS